MTTYSLKKNTMVLISQLFCYTSKCSSLYRWNQNHSILLQISDYIKVNMNEVNESLPTKYSHRMYVSELQQLVLARQYGSVLHLFKFHLTFTYLMWFYIYLKFLFRQYQSGVGYHVYQRQKTTWEMNFLLFGTLAKGRNLLLQNLFKNVASQHYNTSSHLPAV